MSDLSTILSRLDALGAEVRALNGHVPVWPEWMSISTAARYCDISTWKIFRAISNGRLHPARPDDGERRKSRPPEPRLKRTDLDGWMEASRPTRPLPIEPEDGTMGGKARLAGLRGKTDEKN